jgi:hypothetical protein
MRERGLQYPSKLCILVGYLPERLFYPVSMEHGNGAAHAPLHTLIPLADFKAVLGFDDRDDALSRYCPVTAAYTIGQYCKRRLVKTNSNEQRGAGFASAGISGEGSAGGLFNE